jgi:hypothetical protein
MRSYKLIVVSCLAVMLAFVAGTQTTRPATEVVDVLPVVKLKADPWAEWSIPVAVVNGSAEPFVVAIHPTGYLRNSSVTLYRDGKEVPSGVDFALTAIRPDELVELAPGEVRVAKIDISEYQLDPVPGTYTLEWGLSALLPELTDKKSELPERRRLILVVE